MTVADIVGREHVDEFNDDQKKEIEIGISDGLDPQKIKKYARHEFCAQDPYVIDPGWLYDNDVRHMPGNNQMKALREAIEADIPENVIDAMADSRIDARFMREGVQMIQNGENPDYVATALNFCAENTNPWLSGREGKDGFCNGYDELSAVTYLCRNGWTRDMLDAIPDKEDLYVFRDAVEDGFSNEQMTCLFDLSAMGCGTTAYCALGSSRVSEDDVKWARDIVFTDDPDIVQGDWVSRSNNTAEAKRNAVLDGLLDGRTREELEDYADDSRSVAAIRAINGIYSSSHGEVTREDVRKYLDDGLSDYRLDVLHEGFMKHMTKDDANICANPELSDLQSITLMKMMTPHVTYFNRTYRYPLDIIAKYCADPSLPFYEMQSVADIACHGGTTDDINEYRKKCDEQISDNMPDNEKEILAHDLGYYTVGKLIEARYDDQKDEKKSEADKKTVKQTQEALGEKSVSTDEKSGKNINSDLAFVNRLSVADQPGLANGDYSVRKTGQVTVRHNSKNGTDYASVIVPAGENRVARFTVNKNQIVHPKDSSNTVNVFANKDKDVKIYDTSESKWKETGETVKFGNLDKMKNDYLKNRKVPETGSIKTTEDEKNLTPVD